MLLLLIRTNMLNGSFQINCKPIDAGPLISAKWTSENLSVSVKNMGQCNCTRVLKLFSITASVDINADGKNDGASVVISAINRI
jgi:hypothetical protein